MWICEICIWWAGRARPSLPSQHCLTVKGTKMRSLLINLELLQAGSSCLIAGWGSQPKQGAPLTGQTLSGGSFELLTFEWVFIG
jgi:hypothetical protein